MVSNTIIMAPDPGRNGPGLRCNRTVTWARARADLISRVAPVNRNPNHRKIAARGNIMMPGDTNNNPSNLAICIHQDHSVLMDHSAGLMDRSAGLMDHSAGLMDINHLSNRNTLVAADSLPDLSRDHATSAAGTARNHVTSMVLVHNKVRPISPAHAARGHSIKPATRDRDGDLPVPVLAPKWGENSSVIVASTTPGISVKNEINTTPNRPINIATEKHLTNQVPIAPIPLRIQFSTAIPAVPPG